MANASISILGKSGAKSSSEIWKNLSKGERACTLDVFDEYSEVVTIEIKVKGQGKKGIEKQNGFIEGEKIEKIHSGKFKIGLKKETGRTGFRDLLLGVRIGDDEFPFRISIPFHSDNLVEKQFQDMLDDISHWVFFELASPIKMGIDYVDRISESLSSQVAIFRLIELEMPLIEGITRQVSFSSKQKIEKKYYKTIKPTRKLDAKVLQLANKYSGDVRTFTFRKETSYDVYENRFMLFFFYKLKLRLIFLQKLAKRTLESVEKERAREIGLGNDVSQLDRQADEAKKYSQRIHVLGNRLQELEKLDFFKDVDFVPRQFSLNYSLGVIQNFNYGRIFSLYQKLILKNQKSQLGIAEQFQQGLFSLGMKRTSTIYEYWTFFAVYKTLVDFHFYPKDDLLKVINVDTLTPSLKSGEFIHLIGDKDVYGDLEIYLYYEKTYPIDGRQEKYYLRPDITLEAIADGKKYRFLFDAKYKNYKNLVGANSKLDGFWDDDYLTIKDKYGPGGEIPGVDGAFLFHTNTSGDWFVNYGAFIQDEENGTWRENNHEYGFIPLVPGDNTHLKTLLAMIFTVKLKKRSKICWVCNTKSVMVDSKWIHCKDYRDEGWRTDICGNCGFDFLYRSYHGELSFQPRHQDLQPDGNCKSTHSICPQCGKCSECGAHINDIMNPA